MRSRNPSVMAAAAVALIALGTAACGSSTAKPTASKPEQTSGASGTSGTTKAPGAVDPNAPEVVAPGDIPDTQAFVSHAGGGYSFKVPEGWSQSNAGPTTTFTDHFNTVIATSTNAPVPPTTATVQADEVPALARQVPNFELVKIETVSRTAGPVVLVTYRAGSPPNAVTGKRVAIDVERYEFWRAGRQVTLTLSGARGSDNVDPWKTITNSFAWTA